MATHPIHFVGSIGLEDAETVFRSLAENVGDKAFYYPDGETGVRTNWVVWQGQVFADHSGFEQIESGQGYIEGAPPPTHFAPTVEPGALAFSSLGYAAEAAKSFALFSKMKSEGKIPGSVRFQVSLPTPAAVLETFVASDHRRNVLPAYTAAMANEVNTILAAIPHDQLALQWDIAVEVIAADGGMPSLFDNPLNDTVDELQKLCAPIPEEVHLGFHLCYGDPGHKHIIEPRDLGTSVAFANALTSGISRRVDYVHMAVPRDRDDEAYFAPLKNLDIDQTRLNLGLVHFTDGVAGTKKRLATAKQFASGFGIATECGFGRRDPATIPGLLQIHTEVSGSA